MKQISSFWNCRGAKFPILGTIAALAMTACADDALMPASRGMVRLGGFIGGRIGVCISNQVMREDFAKFVKPFADKKEIGDGDWRCEYWGKWATSAALAYYFEPTPGHRAIVEKGAHDLIATAAADGYIGTRSQENRLKGWDVWGRKYVLLGLIAAYDATGDEAVLAAAKKHEDTLIAECGAGRANIADLGYKDWKGLPPCSVLEPTVLLYERTHEQKYLDFAEGIVATWSKPGALNPSGMRLVEDALAGRQPAQIDAPKAYEMMSCYEGLCELYRATGERKYLDASVKLADGIIANEVTIIGSASGEEVWKYLRRNQCEKINKPMETCVTATWMKFCFQLLRLTGDAKYADEMERSLYNALLAAQTPDGKWWAYFTAMSGERVASYVQHEDCATSCCVLNGPRGLLTVPEWAVMSDTNGPVVNLYNDGSANLALHSGNRVKILIGGDYPASDLCTVYVMPAAQQKFTVSLRIPPWSAKTKITVNNRDADVEVKAGTYARITRTWMRGDKIDIAFDMGGRIEGDPGKGKYFAIARGPLVFALDKRLCSEIAASSMDPVSVDLVANPDAAKKAGVWQAFDATLAAKDGTKQTLTICDFASAGNTWDENSMQRVWLPQPLNLATVWSDVTPWQMLTHTTYRPKIPAD